MSCEICGRNSCSRSFHSTESQEQYDRFSDMDRDDLINLVIDLEEEIKKFESDEVNLNNLPFSKE